MKTKVIALVVFAVVLLGFLPREVSAQTFIGVAVDVPGRYAGHIYYGSRDGYRAISACYPRPVYRPVCRPVYRPAYRPAYCPAPRYSVSYSGPGFRYSYRYNGRSGRHSEYIRRTWDDWGYFWR